MHVSILHRIIDSGRLPGAIAKGAGISLGLSVPDT